MLFIVLLYLKYIVGPLSIHYSLEYPRLLLKVCSFLCYFVHPFHSIEHLTLRMLHPLFRHILKSFHPFLCFLSHYHFHHFHSLYWHFIHFNFENIRCIGTVHTRHRSGYRKLFDNQCRVQWPTPPGVTSERRLARSTRGYIGTALRGALYSLSYLLFVVCM